MGVVTGSVTYELTPEEVAVSAYMGVVTQFPRRLALDIYVAVSAYMGVVTPLDQGRTPTLELQSPPTWEL